MNLFLLLGQLGLTDETATASSCSRSGRSTTRSSAAASKALIYSTYSGARFVVAGTPSGISLSREGGAHQSTITPGIGIELPGLVYAEPCYARELEWLLLDGLRGMQEPDGEALYLRLSTKPVDQAPFARARRGARRGGRPRGRARRRLPAARGRAGRRARADRGVRRDRARGALGGRAALRRTRASTPPSLCLSSPDRLYRGWREARLTAAPRRLAARLVPPRAAARAGGARSRAARHGDRRRLALARVPRRLPRRRAPSRSASTASARSAASPRSTRRTRSRRTRSRRRRSSRSSRRDALRQFSATLRVHLEDRAGAFAELARAIAEAGGLLDAIDLVRVEAGGRCAT